MFNVLMFSNKVEYEILWKVILFYASNNRQVIKSKYLAVVVKCRLLYHCFLIVTNQIKETVIFNTNNEEVFTP